MKEKTPSKIIMIDIILLKNICVNVNFPELTPVTHLLFVGDDLGLVLEMAGYFAIDRVITPSWS